MDTHTAKRNSGDAPDDIRQDCRVVSMSELEQAVDAAFVETGAPFSAWPDPNPDRSPDDDAYSRLTNPGRYLIVGARVDAWIAALRNLDLAATEAASATPWVEDGPPTPVHRSERIVARATGALSIEVSRTHLGGVAGSGIVLGVGNPVEPLGRFPDCGCDACDSGSAAELEYLDLHFRGVISGVFRRLRRGSQSITVIDPPGWGARNLTGFRPRQPRVDAILADPRGWTETSGSSWLQPDDVAP